MGREGDLKHAAATLAGADGGGPAVGDGDAADEGEAKAGALGGVDEPVGALGLDADEHFSFVMGPRLGVETDLIPDRLRDAPDDTLVEFRPGDQQVTDLLSRRFADQAGRALFIDYGPARSEPGDTFQAIRGHEKADPLAAPGTADLTARVDFEQLGALARTGGLDVDGPVEQGRWLKALGLEMRAAALMRSAPEKKSVIARQVMRLTEPDQMGELFKVMTFSAQGLPKPPGFTGDG